MTKPALRCWRYLSIGKVDAVEHHGFRRAGQRSRAARRGDNTVKGKAHVPIIAFEPLAIMDAETVHTRLRSFLSEKSIPRTRAPYCTQDRRHRAMS
jgi:hypothetical protein